MASLKLTVFVLVALAFVANSYGNDFTDQLSQGIDKVKEEVGVTTEKKGIFDTLKEKAGNFYESAVEKGKEAYQATKEAVSDGIDKVKEKVNEFREKKPENPVENINVQ